MDKYFSRQDFELCYIDTDSFYLAISGDFLDKIIRPDMKQTYKANKKNWLTKDKFSERTPGLFKPEFVDISGACLTAKCYLVQNKARQNKYIGKGVSKKHNHLYFQRDRDVLDVFLKTRRDGELKHIDRVKNVGFRVYDQGIVTYKQNKLGLSAYYGKRYVLGDNILQGP